MKKYKTYIIIFAAFVAFCVTVCFIPIDATKFIPQIEAQVAKDLGIKIHIEKLILRFGPTLKVKAPVMHMMYEDGQKFGQFDNVKFFIPWSSLFKNDVVVKRLYANKLIIKVNSNDKYLPNVISKIQNKDFEDNPDINLHAYSVTYKDANKNELYKLSGNNLGISKLVNYKNVKVNAIGEFFINDKKYVSYDISVLPNLDISDLSAEGLVLHNLPEQIKALDFHSDIMADIKLYKNNTDNIQISGLVNVDNISVLDPDMKAPKSFIYLTFFGNKTGILSNIYATNDKKVYIDGTINNSKKPDLDLKIKTDNIDIASLYKKVKLFADCSKFNNIKELSGNLVADFAIKGDLNKIKSSGYLKLKDASIKTDSIDVNNIEADIDLSNNVINITNAIGYVQKAPILIKGKIDKNINLELLMSKVELRHLCPKDFGVKTGVMSLTAQIQGTLDNIKHKENLQIDNFDALKDDNKISFNSLKINTNKENIAYISNLCIKPKQTELIKLPMIKLQIDKDFIKIPETNIFMPNSKVTAKANIQNYNTKDMAFSFDLSGFINSKDIKGISSIPAIYPLKLIISGNKSIQNINGQILLENAQILDEPSIINIASKIEDNNLKIDDLSIIPYSGKFTDNFKINTKGSKKLIISGVIENLKNPLIKNIRLFIPQQMNLTTPNTTAQVKGDVFVSGKLDKQEVVGQLNIQNLIDKTLQLNINNLVLDFNKDIVVVNAPVVKLSDSVFGLNATVLSDISKGIFIKTANIKSKYVNTDTLLMYKDSPLLKSFTVQAADGKFFAEKGVVTIYGSPLMMTGISSDFTLKDNIISMKNLSSEMCNGKLAGSINFNLRDEHFNSKLQARGVSAAPIFDVIAIKKDTVSGTMDFDTQISGNISSKQTLNGNIKFIVRNGRMGTLGKLEHLLYAQNVVADNMLRTSLSVVTKAITLKDTGLFKYLRGDIVMKDGIANIKSLQSQGPLMALYIKGQYYPATDYAKLTVLGRLSDEVIAGMGAFGEFSLNKLMVMLTGDENKYSIVPDDIEKLPQLPIKNTKEFMSIINGMLEKPSSVILFNWISYSQKSYRQKELPQSNVKIPDFIESLPY